MKAKITGVLTAYCLITLQSLLGDPITITFRLKSDASKELKNVGGTPSGIEALGRSSRFDKYFEYISAKNTGLKVTVDPEDKLFLFKKGMSTWEPSIGTAQELTQKYGTDITIAKIARTGAGRRKVTKVTMESTQK